MVPDPSPASGTMALFARTCPGAKLSVLVSGLAPSPGKSRAFPNAVGLTTMTLRATERALEGIAHDPVTVTIRVSPPASVKPPPRPVRVSSRRHGVIVKYGAPEGADRSAALAAAEMQRTQTRAARAATPRRLIVPPARTNLPRANGGFLTGFVERFYQEKEQRGRSL